MCVSYGKTFQLVFRTGFFYALNVCFSNFTQKDDVAPLCFG